MKPVHPLLFWKVRDRSPEAHLLGSLHAFRTDIYPLAAHIEAVIDRAEMAMFEIPLCGTPELPYSPAMIQRMTPTEPLELRLASYPQVLARVRMRAAKHHIDFAELRYESLLFITNHIDKAGPAGSDEPTVQGLDDYVRGCCKGRATFEYLETWDESIVHLVNLSPSAQINRLAYYLAETAYKDADAEEAEQAILAGDISVLARQIARDHREHPDWVPAESQMRNSGWVKNIQRVLALGKRTLIVGGAGHFAGEGNVLQLLKKHHGIRADPVRC